MPNPQDVTKQVELELLVEIASLRNNQGEVKPPDLEKLTGILEDIEDIKEKGL